MQSPPTLARRLGLGVLILYGIGDILGAGIYALVGKVTESAGHGAWISFLLSAFLAAITGLTYAELTARIPKSAGAAAFAGAAFRLPIVPFLVGFLVMASGLTSTATVSLAFHGYLQTVVDVPSMLAMAGLIAAVALLAFWGIAFSARTNAVLTVIEIAGLLLVIVIGSRHAMTLPAAHLIQSLTPDIGIAGVLSGATLAFYAFIGFEDLANLAEEAKHPQRDLPRAILISVAVSTMIYLAVIVVVLWVLGVEGVKGSDRPLLEVFVRARFPFPSAAFACVAMVAIANTGLANFVMVTRLIYGMSKQGLIPSRFARVHKIRRTPGHAVALAAVLVAALASTGGVRLLAQTTSLLLVIAFGVLHLSLLKIRRSDAATSLFRVPNWVPWVGLGTCLFLITHFSGGAFVRAGGVMAVGVLCWFIQRVKA
jgi:amino acid transporter